MRYTLPWPFLVAAFLGGVLGTVIRRRKRHLALADFEITNAQGGILMMLASGKFSTASELARELYIDSASMTRMIDRLEKRGLMRRMPRGNDRRIITLKLTDNGERLARQLPEIYASVMNRNFDGFKPEELDILRGLLRKLLETQTGANPVEGVK